MENNDKTRDKVARRLLARTREHYGNLYENLLILDKGYLGGTVVKFIGNPNSHNYPLNVPIMVNAPEGNGSVRHCLCDWPGRRSLEETEGNFIPHFDQRTMILPTLQEIKDLLKVKGIFDFALRYIDVNTPIPKTTKAKSKESTGEPMPKREEVKPPLSEPWNLIFDKLKSIREQHAPKLESQDAAILEILNNGAFGCQNSNVQTLMEALLGKELTQIRRGLIPFSILVPTSNPNNHNYPLNSPVMVLRVDERRGLNIQGELGNNLSTTGIRWATDEEIEVFLRSERVQEHFTQNVLLMF